MTKHTRNGAATRTAKTSTATSLDSSARLYQGAKQRDFSGPMKVEVDLDCHQKLMALKLDLQKRYQLKPWQAESAVTHAILTNALCVLQDKDVLLDFEYRCGSDRWCQRIGRSGSVLLLDDGDATKPVSLEEAAKWYLKMLVRQNGEENISQSYYVGTDNFLRQLRAALPLEYRS